MEDAWTRSTEEIARELGVDLERGLSSQQVLQMRERFGPNSTEADDKTPFWKLVLAQFEDQLVRILLMAAIISFVLALFEEGEEHSLTAFVEPLVIMLILIANAAVGVIQETNAENAIEALKSYVPKQARVIRDGQITTIDAEELVPGDIVEVSSGASIPADMRLAKTHSVTFRVDQAILTGESYSVPKDTSVVPDKRAVNQDKINMLFAGTNVTIGRANGIVTGTGKHTEFGKIKTTIEQSEDVVSPLQKKLDDFGELLSKVILVICIAVWLININHFADEQHGGWVRGAVYYFKIAVALAVAAIPEGLPAVVTTCLALGTMKMAKDNAIVRSLPSVETLGCTTVICSDKTGTLTTSNMSVARCVIVESVQGKNVNISDFSVSGTTYSPQGTITDSATNSSIQAHTLASFQSMARVCSLCNDSRVNLKNDKYEPIGEPTEVALRVLVEKIGADNVAQLSAAERVEACNNIVAQQYTKLATLEFSRDRKSMSVLVRDNQSGAHSFFVKGAPESVMARCTSVLSNDGNVVPMNEQMFAQLNAVLADMSSQALRVLALAFVDAQPLEAYNFSDPSKFHEVETNMTFVGLAGMIDPPRPEVADSIRTCRDAGIRVIVITGDNKTTAEAICRGIGVFGQDEDLAGKSFTGREFDDLGSKEKQIQAVTTASLFSRTEPTHKSTLVELLQQQGEVVAMTGDGVNDAPALKKADIGIGMGSGTEVAKGASDMVLADDNFSTIVSAVREGRSIYANTKQFIRYLISSNIGEVACIFLTAAFGMPEALIPVQLLWVNLVTDGLPATALGFNKPDKDIMKHSPRNSDERIINGWMFFRYMAIGLYVGIATVGSFAYWYLYYQGGPQISWEQLTSFHQCRLMGAADFGVETCDIFFGGADRASTVSLSVLVTIEMFNALNSISENQSLVAMPPWTNIWLIAAVALSFALHFVIVYVPFFASIFFVAPINMSEWMIVIWASLPVIIIDEAFKFLARSITKKRD